jgi:hypothetical protein
MLSLFHFLFVCLFVCLFVFCSYFSINMYLHCFHAWQGSLYCVQGDSPYSTHQTHKIWLYTFKHILNLTIHYPKLKMLLLSIFRMCTYTETINLAHNIRKDYSVMCDLCRWFTNYPHMARTKIVRETL